MTAGAPDVDRTLLIGTVRAFMAVVHLRLRPSATPDQCGHGCEEERPYLLIPICYPLTSAL